MARPKKNNAEYYPHYTGMRNHRKVKALRTKFGQLQGYSFWCMMLEWLSEHDGLEWEYSDLECEMFAAELGVSAAEIREMVDYCLKIELLFITPNNFIYSESLNENLTPLFEKRNRERNRSKTRERRENGTFATTSTGVSAAETPQSKVKESKVKDNNTAEFDEFWNSYAKKADKKKCLQKFNKLSKADREKIKEHLPRYLQATPNIEFRKNPLTYLNGECWNDEHLPIVKTISDKANKSLDQEIGENPAFTGIKAAKQSLRAKANCHE